jgi:hypothetical protein
MSLKSRELGNVLCVLMHGCELYSEVFFKAVPWRLFEDGALVEECHSLFQLACGQTREATQNLHIYRHNILRAGVVGMRALACEAVAV